MSALSSLTTALWLAAAYLRERWLSTSLNVLMLGLGVGTIIALILTVARAEEHLQRNVANIDLVIGAKGSPLQLILSSVFHIDIPTGNISRREAQKVIVSPLVKRAIPLALGDSYRGFRLVGTTPDYAHVYDASLAAGAWWAGTMQAVIGADVAYTTKLAVGASFASTHGLVESSGTHENQPFVVTGILAPTGTVIDRLILTDVASIQHMHATESPPHAEPDHADEGDEVTAYLVQYASPLAAASFPRQVNASSGLQAAAPALESARLFALIGIGIAALKGFAFIMVACAALGIFIGLTNALNECRADLALLRVLGAGRGTVCLTIMAQGLALGVAGVILGIMLGHLSSAAMRVVLEKSQHVQLAPLLFVREEAWVILVALLLSLIAALFPTWKVYREAVPQNLVAH
ncbi:MAG: ABC transporter permease [Betaproteobacteria bacterium]|nr:ABC transporter permease [Betaproteobacteria bacterium]